MLIPAEFSTITRQVIDKPASTKRIPIPSVTQKVERRLIDQPATVREIDVPAQFETITSKVMVAEGHS